MLDLRNKFDSINHEMLSVKLEKYGVKGICLQWFESFLKEQRHCVQVTYVFLDFLFRVLAGRSTARLNFWAASVYILHQ